MTDPTSLTAPDALPFPGDASTADLLSAAWHVSATLSAGPSTAAAWREVADLGDWIAEAARCCASLFPQTLDERQPEPQGRRFTITCPRCHRTRTQEYGEPIPNTDDTADCVRCLDCGHAWATDPGADGACADCGGSGNRGGEPREGKCHCIDRG